MSNDTYKDGPQERKCLICTRLFKSACKANRICPACKKSRSASKGMEPLSDSDLSSIADRLLSRYNR